MYPKQTKRNISVCHLVIFSTLLFGIVFVGIAVSVVLVITLKSTDWNQTTNPNLSTATAITTTAPDLFNDVFNETIYSTRVRQNIEQQNAISRLLIDEFKPMRIRDDLRSIASAVHIAGTPAQARLARQLVDRYRSLGFTVETHEYRVLLSYPDWQQPNTIELISSGRLLSNGLSDPLGPADAIDQQQVDAQHARLWWNAYSTSGSITRSVVYANYGSEADFDRLAANHINVSDRIVLIRYGGVFRADAVAEATWRGAVGAILFSDPADYAPDGVATTFPNGIWLPASGAQRGTLKKRFGDPQTPRFPSTAYAYRFDEQSLQASGDIPRIPVTPIGYRDAIHIFDAMDGAVAFDDWHGRMNVTYRLASSESTRFRLNVSCHTEHQTITNVLAYMRGRDEPDRTVLLSNHFDSWVYGAIDPNSGTATLLEVARVLAVVANSTGWRPQRTIAFGQWDAEEFGIVGSTEWVEEMAKVLQTRLVAVLNVDEIYGNVSLTVAAVPLLYRAMLDASRRVASPNPVELTAGRYTLFDSWCNYDPIGPIVNDSTIPAFDLPGSGSDFNRFLHFVGTPVVDFSLKCAPTDCEGLYHSMYAIPWTVEHLIDPTFRAYTAVGQLWLELARQLADSLVIPFNASDYAAVFPGYVNDLDRQLRAIGFEQHVGKLSYQSMFLNLNDAIGRFQHSADVLQSHVDRANSGSATVTFRQMQMLNDRLIEIERAFIADNGIYREQSINRHVVYSPTINNEYAGSTFAGIRDPAANWRKCTKDDINCVDYWTNTAILGFTKLQYAIESAVLLLDLQGF